MAAMAPSEKSYLKTGVFALAKNRILWLLVLMISGMITGGILGRYEAAFSVMPLLVTFIPMLTDTGRERRQPEQHPGHPRHGGGGHRPVRLPQGALEGAEGQPAGGRGPLPGQPGPPAPLLPGKRAGVRHSHPVPVATVVLAKTIGGALPMLAKLVRADPAIMAAPLITTIVDALSLVLYFTIASRLLHL